MSKNHRIKYLFIVPAIIWVLCFTVFPLLYSLTISMFKIENSVKIQREKIPVLDKEGEAVMKANGQPRMRTKIHRQPISVWTFIDIANFKRIFKDPQALEAMRITSLFIMIAVPFQMLLGLACALLFNKHIAWRGPLRTLMILPIFATPLAVGYMFFTIFYEEGGPLGFLGIPFLSNSEWALISVIIVDVWQWTPFCFLIFLAALQGISQEILDVAMLDCRNGRDRLLYVILPMIQPTIIIVLLLRLTEALKLFDIPFAMTGGGPGVATQSYSLLAFRTGLRYFDVGYASAMSYVLLITVMIIVTLLFKRIRSAY
jgi:multiple sugar transport system permease protein